MDCSLPGSSVHGIFQARVLEWVAISFSRGSSQPREQTQVSHSAVRRFITWATTEAQFIVFMFSNVEYMFLTLVFFLHSLREKTSSQRAGSADNLGHSCFPSTYKSPGTEDVSTNNESARDLSQGPLRNGWYRNRTIIFTRRGSRPQQMMGRGWLWLPPPSRAALFAFIFCL